MWLLGFLARSGGRRPASADADALLGAGLVTELDGAIGGGEEGVAPPHADVLAGVEGAAALANDDRARQDTLSVATLHAKPLAGRVAAVPAGAAGFLVCHLVPLLLALRLVSPVRARVWAFRRFALYR